MVRSALTSAFDEMPLSATWRNQDQLKLAEPYPQRFVPEDCACRVSWSTHLLVAPILLRFACEDRAKA